MVKIGPQIDHVLRRAQRRGPQQTQRSPAVPPRMAHLATFDLRMGRTVPFNANRKAGCRTTIGQAARPEPCPGRAAGLPAGEINR